MKKESGIQISVEDLLKSETILFDIYFWMPRNNKLIKIANAGDLFQECLLPKYINSTLTFFKDPNSEIKLEAIPIEIEARNAPLKSEVQTEQQELPEPANELELPQSDLVVQNSIPATLVEEPISTIEASTESAQEEKVFSSDPAEIQDEIKISGNQNPTEEDPELRFSADTMEDPSDQKFSLSANPHAEVPEDSNSAIKSEKEFEEEEKEEERRFKSETENGEAEQDLEITRVKSSRITSANYLSVQLAYALGYTQPNALTTFSLNSMKYFDEISENSIPPSGIQFSLLDALKQGGDQEVKAVSDFKDMLAFLEEYFEDIKSSDKEKEIVESALDRTLQKLKNESKLNDPMNLIRWKGMLSRNLSMDSYSYCNKSAVQAQKELKAAG